MKKSKLMIAAFLTVLALNGFAKGNENVSDKAANTTTTLHIQRTSNEEVYRVVYQSKVEGLVKISIYNEQGDLLLEDRILNENGFARPYNFEALPVGNYTIKIVDANGNVTKNIYHGTKLISDTAPIGLAKIQVKAIENSEKYELSVLGSTTQYVEVNILDATGNVIFADQVNEKGSFSKVYDLSKVNLKGLTFEILQADQTAEKFTF